MRIAVGILIVLLAQTGWASEQMMPRSREECEAMVDSAGRVYYEAKCAFYPALATSRGMRAHDGELSTFSLRQLHRFLVRTKRMQNRLGLIWEDSLSLEKWIDYKALLADVTTQVFLLEDLEVWRSRPTLYADACVEGIYTLLVRPDRAGIDSALASRLSQIPEVVKHGRRNLTEPSLLHCEAASATLKDLLPFLADLPAQYQGFNVDEAVLEAAVASLEGFVLFLDSLAVGADPDFALGYDNFTRLLEMEHMVYETPDELEARAEHVLARARQKKGGSAVAGDVATAGLPAAGDVIGHYRAETDSASAFIRRRNLMPLPDDSGMMVVETPDFLRALIPGYAYRAPGAFDTEQVGVLYVAPAPEGGQKTKEQFRSGIETGRSQGHAVHEVYPGRHVQISMANRHPSFIRRLQDNAFTLQGWALYCEEMMATEGYGGDDQMKRVLDATVYRAACMIATIRLHLGQYSLDEAAAFMIKETGAPDDLVDREVRRYALEPWQAMGYIIGKSEMMRLRDDVRGTLGESFTLRVFHDSVLSCGSIPLYLLRACVMSSFK